MKVVTYVEILEKVIVCRKNSNYEVLRQNKPDVLEK